MKRKYILMFMYLLTSVCIFSIGFSSWTIVQNATIDTSGNIIAEDIITDSDYIRIEESLSTSLKYYETGFIDDSNNVTLIGTMNITYTIDLYNCKEMYGTDVSDLIVLVTLESNVYNLFSVVEENATIKHGDTSIAYTRLSDSVQDPDKYVLSFTLSNVLDNVVEGNEYAFTVYYEFKASDYNYYKTNIYPNIGKVKFNASALINGE